MFHRRRHPSPLLLAAALAALPASRVRANVGVNEGFIAGTITFDADFLPDAMDVDAGDTVTHTFISRGSATFVGSTSPSPGRIVSTWSYNLPVEAVLATTYRLRPVAKITALAERAPFPDSPDVITVSAGNTTNYDYPYRPVILSGQVAISNLQSQSIPARSFFLSAFDVTGEPNEVIQPDCVGSIAFCLSASQIAGAAIGSTYELYLKPGHSYSLNPQGISIAEDTTMFGSQAYSAMEFNDGQAITAPAAAVNPTDPTPTITLNYVLTDQAELGGQLSLAVPAGFNVFSSGITLQGTSVLGLDYVDEFFPSPWNPTGIYVARAFTPMDLTQPAYVTPSFALSQNGYPALYFPKQPVTLIPGQSETVNLSFEAGLIQGSFGFNPPYQVKGIYPEIQAQTASLGLTTNTFVPDATNGASFELVAFAGDWSYWGFGWDFNMGDPNFDSTYVLVSEPLADAQVTGFGGVTLQNFTFDVDLVKVYFTAPDSSGLTDPQLTAFASAGYEQAHGSAFNQNNVAIGESRVVLRVPSTPTAFTITPSATIHGAVVNFSPITLTPAPNHTYVIGTPGNVVLSVTSPQPNASSTTCNYQVTGTAGGIPITNITVNGQAVPFAADPSASDPYQVSFSTTVNELGSSITVTAYGQSGSATYHVSDVIPVLCLNQPPQITSCPGGTSTQCGSFAGGTQTLTVGVTDPDGDPLTVTWTVDGTLAATHSLAGGATSDSFTHTYAVGAHTIAISVSDGQTPAVGCSTTVTVIDTLSPKVIATVAVGTLWPPNHDLVNVGLAVSDKDTCDPSPSLGILVYSNESDLEETGSGNFSPDAKNIAAGTLRLRSERKGNGNGRVYLILAAGTNSAGDVGVDCATVVVPHDQSAASIAQVNAMAAAARATCLATSAAPVGYYQVGIGPVVGPKQ